MCYVCFQFLFLCRAFEETIPIEILELHDEYGYSASSFTHTHTHTNQILY